MKRSMIKITGIVMVLLLLLNVSACGNREAPPAENTTVATTVATTAPGKDSVQADNALRLSVQNDGTFLLVYPDGTEKSCFVNSEIGFSRYSLYTEPDVFSSITPFPAFRIIEGTGFLTTFFSDGMALKPTSLDFPVYKVQNVDAMDLSLHESHWIIISSVGIEMRFIHDCLIVRDTVTNQCYMGDTSIFTFEAIEKTLFETS